MYDLQASAVPGELTTVKTFNSISFFFTVPRFVDRIKGLKSGVMNELNFIDTPLDTSVIAAVNRHIHATDNRSFFNVCLTKISVILCL